MFLGLPRRSRRARPRLRTAAAALAALALAAFAHARPDPPTRWALVVGVGDYANYGDEEGGDLFGSAADARNLRDVLVARWGFRPEHVRLLTDSAATRDAIRAAFTEWLPAAAKPGDLVVFYFSGHGSQVLDESGDEDDGLDETLCPADVLRRDAARDIRDDELNAWLRALPTREVTVILDACHSGTATRAFGPGIRRKALARPEPDPLRDAPRPAPAERPGNATDATDAADGVLEISASQADQFAVETVVEENGVARAGGAFTVPLVRHLWQLPTGT
ncbi:MAG TPA: caspase family protein, partial [Longimicrobiaceae bacterium]|nr:caspase family protein [Longimicrobiaceae bacterium]